MVWYGMVWYGMVWYDLLGGRVCCGIEGYYYLRQAPIVLLMDCFDERANPVTHDTHVREVSRGGEDMVRVE